MGFYEELAGAKTRGGASDGDYILPNQTGTLVIHRLINKQTSLKRTVILVGEILTSRAKVEGAKLQPKGTKVKKIYALSKFDFHINMLKTDLVRIVGADEKEMTPKQVAELFKAVFEDGQLKGVVCSFDSFTKLREGKTGIDSCNFGHLDETKGNSDAEIAARVAGIPDLE